MERKDLSEIIECYDIRKTGEIFTLDGKKVSQYDNGYGYLNIRHNGSYYRVHRLVATKFIPNPENKSDVNHIDGNKKNNSLDNLEWTTRSENVQHAHKSGLITEKATEARRRNGKAAGKKYGKLVGESNRIKIDFYIQDKFIRTYESSLAAHFDLGISPNRILAQCRGKKFQVTKRNEKYKDYNFKFNEER